MVLSEIATRALSAAVNDPGTAIGVIGRLTRLLNTWAQASRKPSDADAERGKSRTIRMYMFRQSPPWICSMTPSC